MNKPEYDVTITKAGGTIALHICSECNGTKEITGHKYWCSKLRRNKLNEAKEK